MGIILIPLGLLVTGLYFWVGVKGVRWAYRRFAMTGAIVTTIAFLLLPTWDTIVNRWYHKSVLCTRSDVGLRIYDRVKLPPQYYDNYGRFKEPEGWFSGRSLIEGRYQRKSGRVEEGTFPFTRYEKRFSSVLDTRENKEISQEVDYLTRGGGWWLIVFRPLFSQVDFSSYVRGMIDGVTCDAILNQGGGAIPSINAVFEQR